MQNRLTHPLFKTEKWVRNLELGLIEAYKLHTLERKVTNIHVKHLIPPQGMSDLAMIEF